MPRQMIYQFYQHHTNQIYFAHFQEHHPFIPQEHSEPTMNLSPSSDPVPLLQATLHSHTYLLLTQQDQIQPENGPACHEEELHTVLARQLTDLNFLLYLDHFAFWQHLQRQESSCEQDFLLNDKLPPSKKQFKSRLRSCLQSCLDVFTRKAYLRYNSNLLPFGAWWQQLSPRTLALERELKKVVLTLFYRISRPLSSQEKTIMYDSWYIDTTKALDICLIYGESNPRIVTQIVGSMFSSMPKQYEMDFQTVVQFIDNRLDNICQQLFPLRFDVDSSEQIAVQQKNFVDVLETLFEVYHEFLFQAFDIILNLKAMLTFFPERCRRYLLSQTLVFKKIIIFCLMLQQRVHKQWKIGKQQAKFTAFARHIKHKIAEVLSLALEKIHLTIEQLLEKNPSSPQLEKMKVTLFNIGFTALYNVLLGQEAHIYESQKEELQKNILNKEDHLAKLKELERQRAQRIKDYAKYGQDLLAGTFSLSRKPLFNVPKTIGIFNSQGKHYNYLLKFVQLEKRVRSVDLPHLKQLIALENFSLSQLKSKPKKAAQVKLNKKALRLSKKTQTEYDDEPEEDTENWGIDGLICNILNESQSEASFVEEVIEGDVSEIRQAQQSFSSSDCTILEALRDAQVQMGGAEMEAFSLSVL